MQDMLKQDLKVGDTVAYVYVNDNGKVSTITGKIEAFARVDRRTSAYCRKIFTGNSKSANKIARDTWRGRTRLPSVCCVVQRTG